MEALRAEPSRPALCLVCWAVFKLTDLSPAHGAEQKYLATANGKPENHCSFMEVVKKHDEHVNRTRAAARRS